MQNLKISFPDLAPLADAIKDLDDVAKASVLRSLNNKLAKKFVVERLISQYPYKTHIPPREFIKSTAVKGDKTAVQAGVTGGSPTAHLLELGTVMRTQDSTGRSTGMIEAQRKIGPIIESTVVPISLEWAKIVGDEINKGIERRTKSKIKKLGA